MSAKDIEGKSEREILILVYDRLGDMEDRVEQYYLKLTDLEETQQRLQKTIFGNGEVGLQEEHRALTREVNNAKKVVGWLGASLAVLISGLLFKIFTGEWSIVIK